MNHYLSYLFSHQKIPHTSFWIWGSPAQEPSDKLLFLPQTKKDYIYVP